MTKTVRVKDLRAGMRVIEPIVGKKGDVKVNKGEILSKLHVDKLNKWHGTDAANPRGIEVESTLASGSEEPGVMKRPWESPLIESKSKQKVHASMVVGVSFDKQGNIIRDAKPETEEQEQEDVKPRNARKKAD